MRTSLLIRTFLVTDGSAQLRPPVGGANAVRSVWMGRLAVGGLAVLLAGCAGYRLGTTLPAEIKTIYVPTFLNKTDEPEVENVTTRAARQEFQNDGTLRIVDAAERADLVLDTTLTAFTLEPVRYSRTDDQATQEYRLTLTAQIVAHRRKTGTTLVQRTVQGETTFVFNGDLASAKLTALPNAAADLAHKIVAGVTESW